MYVSIIDWNPNYWVDYSEQWAEVFIISKEDFEKIKNWTATLNIETKQVEDIIPTPEEIRESRKESEVDILCPVSVRDNPTYYDIVKGKIKELKEDRYSEIKFAPTDDGEYIRVYNIILKNIPQFLTVEAYQWYLQLWMVFHSYITDYFTSLEENE